MDAVVTYVNKNDQIWRKKFDENWSYWNGRTDIDKTSKTDLQHTNINSARFNNVETLEMCLNGIRKNISWIRNIHLVVSNVEQIPKYAHKYDVNVVLHEDFVPKKWLPAFNSNILELNLHRIPGLSENFLYFNDDVVVLNELKMDQLIHNGSPLNMYYTMGISDYMKFPWCRIFHNSYVSACQLSGKQPRENEMECPQHGIYSMSKWSYEEVWKKNGEQLEKSMTTFRLGSNFNQYLFMLYGLYVGKEYKSPFTYRFFREEISDIIKSQDEFKMWYSEHEYDFVSKYDVVCLN